MYTILIADDEAGIVEILAFVFESNGYQVITAADGDKAYESLQTNHVDLVISGYMMPGMNGLQLCFEMINDRRIGFKPFILISAFIEAIRTAPVQAVFWKPLDIDLLVLEVKKFLPCIR